MTISTADVHRALHQLGELRFGSMPVQDAMERIVHTTHALFDVDGAGLMLIDAEQRLRSVAVSDARFAALEQTQLQHDEGPCIAAYEGKELVCVEDLRQEERWPAFRAEAVGNGLLAVLASPIPYNQQAIGVVAVVSAEPRPWSPEGELALLAFTDLAALLIATMLRAEQQTELAGQLQGALDSRTVIERAKGVLIEREGLSAGDAYHRLRDQARRERRTLATVAAEIADPDPANPR